jgi:hypothetical protein
VAAAAVWIDVGQVRGRSDARIQPARHGYDQYKHDDARGLEVSPCGFLQNQLLKGQIRNGPAKMVILFLQPFEFLHLVLSHAVVLFAPAVIRLLRNANRSDRIKPRLSLTNKNFNLP